MRVLLVSRDTALNAIFSVWAKAQHIAMEVEFDINDASVAVRVTTFDAVLLACEPVPLASFPALAKANRSVLVVSHDATLETKVAALRAGADDYIVRPFHLAELGARLRACVRRRNGHAVSLLQIGNVTLDLDSCRCSIGNRQVHLQPRMYKLLECLMLRRGRVVTKDGLFSYMYGMDTPEPKILDVYVSHLRRVLKDADADMEIRTAWGRGFEIAA